MSDTTRALARTNKRLLKLIERQGQDAELAQGLRQVAQRIVELEKRVQQLEAKPKEKE